MVTTQDADLAAVKNDLLAIGKTATTETYNALVKIGAAITTGVPATLTDIEKLAADRAIAMLPPQFQAEAQLAAGLATGVEKTLNTAITTVLTKEIGFVLARLHVALPGWTP